MPPIISPTRSASSSLSGSNIRGSPESGQYVIVAVALMIAAAAAALATTVMTVSGIIGYTSGPVTLVLPVTTTHHAATGLMPGVTGHFTAMEATLPALPSGPGGLLAWAASLNQIGILAFLALMFLLAHRLRSEILFTPGSAWIVGTCGAVLASTGTVGQFLDAIARSRLAEMIGANARTRGSPTASPLISTLPR